MQRRNFLKNGFVAGAATLVSSSLLAQEKKSDVTTSDSKPFKLNYA
ncbi:MAG: hypothetical protein JWR72_2521, partial [Flavisolibacter sp.]|nr:hypothetical protein [Flavisolibacter sp.]